jgi:hypothetical protein
MKLPRKSKKKFKKDCPYSQIDKYSWEWFYFKRRVEVRCMEVTLLYPKYDIEQNKYEFDPKNAKIATNEQLLAFYKEHYPNDKIAHCFCMQNRHKWDKFN